MAVIGVDPDGNLFGFLIPLAVAAAKGAAISATVYTAAAVANGADLTSREFWNGFGTAALKGGMMGGIMSAGATVGNVVSNGVTGTAVGTGLTNMGMAMANGEDFGSALGFGAVGFGVGAFGASGGFGLARTGPDGGGVLGLGRRLAYQGLTSSMRSVGNNLASGSKKPFDNSTFGLGPVNFRIGKGQKLIQWQDNKFMAISNAVAFGSIALPGGESNVHWDWKSLSFNYTGGPMHKILGSKYGAITLGAIYDVDPGADPLMDHEGTHLWMQRAMGAELFAGASVYNWITAGIQGRNLYHGNYLEEAAYTNPFYGEPMYSVDDYRQNKY